MGHPLKWQGCVHWALHVQKPQQFSTNYYYSTEYRWIIFLETTNSAFLATDLPLAKHHYLLQAMLKPWSFKHLWRPTGDITSKNYFYHFFSSHILFGLLTPAFAESTTMTTALNSHVTSFFFCTSMAEPCFPQMPADPWHVIYLLRFSTVRTDAEQS